MKNINTNLSYIRAVIIMVLLGCFMALVIVLVRPDKDNVEIIASIFGLLTPTTLSLLAFMKSQETHLSVNSRLDDFISEASTSAKAQGIIEGRNEANERNDKLAKEGKK